MKIFVMMTLGLFCSQAISAEFSGACDTVYMSERGTFNFSVTESEPVSRVIKTLSGKTSLFSIHYNDLSKMITYWIRPINPREPDPNFHVSSWITDLVDDQVFGFKLDLPGDKGGYLRCYGDFKE